LSTLIRICAPACAGGVLALESADSGFVSGFAADSGLGCSAAAAGLASLPLAALLAFGAAGGLGAGSAPAAQANARAKHVTMNSPALKRLRRPERRMIFPGFAQNQRSALVA